MFLIYSPDGSNVCGIKGGEVSADTVSVGGWKLQNRVSRGHCLFTPSDSFAVNVTFSHNAQHHRWIRLTDGQTELGR